MLAVLGRLPFGRHVQATCGAIITAGLWHGHKGGIWGTVMLIETETFQPKMQGTDRLGTRHMVLDFCFIVVAEI